MPYVQNLRLTEVKLQGTRVTDPHHFNADPDPAFHLNADPDLAFHLNADPDLAFLSSNADPAPDPQPRRELTTE